MISSGLNFSQLRQDQILERGAEFRPAVLGGERRVDDGVVVAALALGAGARKQRHLVRRAVHHGRVRPEDVLGAVAVMHVEIDDGRARDAVFALGVARGDGDVVEEAEAHRLADLGVVAGRAHRDEGVAMLARHHGFGRRDRAADAAHHRFPRARRHRGVAIDIDQSAGRRDVAQLGDVVLVVAERDEVEIALRRLVAHQELEALMRQRLLHRAQAVGPFGVSGRRDVVEAGLVGEEKRTHQVGLMGCGLSTSLGASGAKTQMQNPI